MSFPPWVPNHRVSPGRFSTDGCHEISSFPSLLSLPRRVQSYPQSRWWSYFLSFIYSSRGLDGRLTGLQVPSSNRLFSNRPAFISLPSPTQYFPVRVLLPLVTHAPTATMVSRSEANRKLFNKISLHLGVQNYFLHSLLPFHSFLSSVPKTVCETEFFIFYIFETRGYLNYVAIISFKSFNKREKSHGTWVDGFVHK